jgi:hypothetical protein
MDECLRQGDEASGGGPRIGLHGRVHRRTVRPDDLLQVSQHPLHQRPVAALPAAGGEQVERRALGIRTHCHIDNPHHNGTTSASGANVTTIDWRRSAFRLTVAPAVETSLPRNHAPRVRRHATRCQGTLSDFRSEHLVTFPGTVKSS